MALKKGILKLLFLCMLSFNLSVFCMEEIAEENKITLESLPNELLLLICYQRIENIINVSKAPQRQEAFKKFLSSICLTNKRFYQFKTDLEKYFDEEMPIEVSDVKVNMNDYSLSFKIGRIEFKAKADDDISCIEFANNLKEPNVTEELLKAASKEIIQKLTEQSEAMGIWGSIINDVYKNTDDAQKDKIRAFIRPLFAYYKFAKANNNEDNTYITDLIFYGLSDEEITSD